MTRKFLVPINTPGLVDTGSADIQNGLTVSGGEVNVLTDFYQDPGTVMVVGALETDDPAHFGSTVTLAADPTLALQAATKQYVDGKVVGLNEVYIGNTDPGAAYELWVDTT